MMQENGLLGPRFSNESVENDDLTSFSVPLLPSFADTHKVFSRNDPRSCERVERVNAKPKKNKAMKRQMFKSAVPPLVPQQIPLDLSKLWGNHQEYLHDDFEPIGIFDEDGSVEREEELDKVVMRLFPAITNKLETNTDLSNRVVSPASLHEDQAKSPECSPPSKQNPLHTLFTNFVENFDAELEPRRIQDMVAAPNRWYNSTPTMTPEQLAVMEIFLPVALPGAFYYLELGSLALLCGFLLIIVHTVECLCTNFGGGAWYKGIIGPLQHIMGDMILNHLLNSTLLLLGPDVFGSHCVPTALALIVANTTMAIVDYKVHFEAFILPLQRVGKVSIRKITAKKILQFKLDRHIRRMVQFYTCAWTLLAVAFSLTNDILTQTLAVVVYNMSPFVSDLSYWLEFSKLLRLLPKRDRTLLSDRHLAFLVAKGSASKQQKTA
jgi:hypothetical protein